MERRFYKVLVLYFTPLNMRFPMIPSSPRPSSPRPSSPTNLQPQNSSVGEEAADVSFQQSPSAAAAPSVFFPEEARAGFLEVPVANGRSRGLSDFGTAGALQVPAARRKSASEAIDPRILAAARAARACPPLPPRPFCLHPDAAIPPPYAPPEPPVDEVEEQNADMEAKGGVKITVLAMGCGMDGSQFKIRQRSNTDADRLDVKAEIKAGRLGSTTYRRNSFSVFIGISPVLEIIPSLKEVFETVERKRMLFLYAVRVIQANVDESIAVNHLNYAATVFNISFDQLRTIIRLCCEPREERAFSKSMQEFLRSLGYDRDTVDAPIEKCPTFAEFCERMLGTFSPHQSKDEVKSDN
jgi:hypothetical protein